MVSEPRGSDVLIGALLCEPVDRACAAGVIFFNNVGYLGVCGHGTIGLIATLAYMKRIPAGEHRIETPVGEVSAILHENGEVSVNNVASYRSAANVAVDVPGYGTVHGDVAWGGNWFFLISEHHMELTLQSMDDSDAQFALTRYSQQLWQHLRPQLPMRGRSILPSPAACLLAGSQVANPLRYGLVPGTSVWASHAISFSLEP